MVKSLRVVLSVNPTAYKVAVSENLYGSTHDIWMQVAPISEITYWDCRRKSGQETHGLAPDKSEWAERREH
jgi:hypothetical protein